MMPLGCLYACHHSIGKFVVDVGVMAGVGQAGDVGVGHVGGKFPVGLEVGNMAYGCHLLCLGVGRLSLDG